MKEYMEYFKEEILRGLRLFGWSNGYRDCEGDMEEMN